MATLTLVTKPTYTLEVDADELRVLTALVGATSGASLARALDTTFGTDYGGSSDLPPEFPALGTLWSTLDLS